MGLLKPFMGWPGGSPRENAAASKLVSRDKRADTRFHGRFKIKSRVTLSWQDADGRSYTMPARAIDMSRVGARVESSEPMAAGAFVFVQAPALNLMGGATVRHCVRRGLAYRIGLEFRHPLTTCF